MKISGKNSIICWQFSTKMFNFLKILWAFFQLSQLKWTQFSNSCINTANIFAHSNTKLNKYIGEQAHFVPTIGPTNAASPCLQISLNNFFFAAVLYFKFPKVSKKLKIYVLFQIAWTRVSDGALLTAGNRTFTRDPRWQVSKKSANIWVLNLRWEVGKYNWRRLENNQFEIY